MVEQVDLSGHEDRTLRVMRILARLYQLHPIPCDLDSDLIFPPGDGEDSWQKVVQGFETLNWLVEKGCVTGRLEPFRLEGARLTQRCYVALFSIFTGQDYLGEMIVEAVSDLGDGWLVLGRLLMQSILDL